MYPFKVKLGRLIKQLKSEYPSERSGAANSIATIGPRAKRAVPSLRRCLKDPDINVRAGSAWALRHLGSVASAAIPSLLDAMNDSEWPVRVHSAEALGRFHSWTMTVLDALATGLEDPHPRVREASALALAEIGPRAKWAAPAIARRLSREKYADVKRALATALAQVLCARRRKRPSYY